MIPGGYPMAGWVKLRAAMPEHRPEEACGHESKQDQSSRRENILILYPAV